MTPGGDSLARGSRVLIRRKRMADASDDYRWRCDPEVARYDGLEPLTMTYSDFAALHAAEIAYADNRRQAFAIDTVEGAHIGSLMFYNARQDRAQVELGVSISDADFRGRGLGTEALVLFACHLFEERGFRRLVMHTFEWNTRAHHSFERAGFRVVARVVRDSATLLRMEALRDEWLAAYRGGLLPGPRDRYQPVATRL